MCALVVVESGLPSLDFQNIGIGVVIMHRSIQCQLSISYTPPSMKIHVFIYMSLNPIPHGGIQMP
jgi:hypothetical protein